MERISTWEEGLQQFLAEAPSMDFGETLPCARFVAAAALVITGKDFAPELANKRKATAAAREYQAEGEAYLVRMMDARLPEKPVAFSQRGDVVLHDGALGLCIGAEAVFLATGDGGFQALATVPLLECNKAWAV